MKTAVIGFPRVGALRELKFATEKYFRGELNEAELRKTAAEIRKYGHDRQKENGIDFISSNDFSFYDGLLDTAVLFNIIPQRYKALNLSELDTYFAMARGYQGEKGDAKALAMKKWFNTNYHYMVPEIDDETKIELVGNKPFDEYKQALKSGLETKIALAGPFTLLKLASYKGKKGIEDFALAAAHAYADFLARANELGVRWVQLDEPFMVHDLGENDIELIKNIYGCLCAAKGNTRLLLQTYFGDIRDCYEDIAALDVDGIGLDFIEGKKTSELVEKYGFPKDKLLFAGVVNGKNIWRCNYEKALAICEGLNKKGINYVLNTSCSLLHVPYTTQSENKLGKDYLEHFAFAEEKLTELRELKELVEAGDYKNNPLFVKNKALFGARKNCTNEAVRARVAQIKPQDYVREPSFEQREKIQKQELGLPLLPTTTIGSFPQTADVKAERRLLRNGEISQEQYDKFIAEKIKDCIQLQEKLGLDALVHGEYERNDMVEYFGEQLSGYVFTEKAWVQSYGTRCVKPPIVWGDVSREKPMTVKWAVYAQSLTDKPVKGMLTGPVTILNWSFPREDISLKESTLQLALAIRDEVLDLERNGIRIIQVDEAALREKLPLRRSDWYSEYLDWAIPAFRLVHSGVKAQTQIHTHMCYSEFEDIIKAIDDMDADVITFEASRSSLHILDSLQQNCFKTEVGPGVYDIHSPRIPSVDEIKAALDKMLTKIKPEKLWVNPDCGLKTRGTAETEASLVNLVEAAKAVRKTVEKN